MTTSKQVTVQVADRWRVVHPVDGTAHTKGDALTVDENVAREWIDAGWVVEVKPTKATPRSKR